MNVRELRQELFAIEDQERKIFVQDTNGWYYDLYISDDGLLAISPLEDTKQDGEG